MSEGIPQFTRLNLVRRNVSEIEIYGFLRPEEADLLRDAFPELDAGRQFLSVVHYSRNSVKHRIAAFVSAGPDERPPFIYLQYETEPAIPAPQPRELGTEQQFLERIATVPVELQARCEATFLFPATLEDKVVSWFPLPMDFSAPRPDLESPLTQIRGIRGVKLENDDSGNPDNIEYSFVLDRPTNRDVLLGVTFNMKTQITGDLPGVVLERAKRVAMSLDLY